MFHRSKKTEPEPEAKPDSKAEDIKQIKAWIIHIADPKFKESDRRDQVNRDNITRLGDRHVDLDKDIRALWKEKDAEKQARDQEIVELRKVIRQLKTELDKKADKPKPAKSTKA